MQALKRYVALLAIGAAILAVLSGCGSSGSAETTSEVERPSAEPPVYHQKEYDVETGWELDVSDRKVGSYLETVWHDPAIATSKLIIDSRPAEGAPPPLVAAELARVQANWLPNYRERSLKRVKLGPRSSIRFAFHAAGEDRIEYFFEECGTSIVFRGSTAPIAYSSFSRFYRLTAAQLRAVCDE